MRNLVFLFVLFCSSFNLFSQINVELKNGKQYQGVIFLNSSDSLKIESINLTFEDDYSNNLFDLYRFEFNNKNIKTNNRSTQYYELGMTLGTPGGINMNLGYVYKKFGLRGNIGTVPGFEIYGYQFNLFFNLVNSERVEIGFSCGYGYNYVSSWPFGDFERKYLGLFSHINLSGFFIEYGRGFEISNLNNNKPLLQFGYIGRFK